MQTCPDCRSAGRAADVVKAAEKERTDGRTPPRAERERSSLMYFHVLDGDFYVTIVRFADNSFIKALKLRLLGKVELGTLEWVAAAVSGRERGGRD